MKKRYIILAILGTAAELLLGGCAHAPVHQLPQASHVALDVSMIAAKTSQQQAAKKVAAIIKHTSNPASKQELVDLQSQINDLGFKLNTATAQIQWYELQYQNLYVDNTKTHAERDWFKADDDKHIAGEAFWRKRAQVILYFLAIAFAWKFYGLAQKMCVSPVLGWIGYVIPGVAAILGAAIGYAFGLYVLGWIAQFLP